MSSAVETLPVRLELDMGGGRKPRVGRPSVGKGRQIGLRLSDEMIADLEFIAGASDGDLSTVIRDILAEHIPSRMARARKIRAERDAERKLRDETGGAEEADGE